MNDLKIYCIYHDKSQIFDYNLDNVPEYIELFNVNDLNMKGDNINYLNSYLCELCAYYYIYKNQVYSKYVGFCHYRRFFKKINFDNLEKYKIHYRTCIYKSIDEIMLENLSIYDPINNNNLYNYLKSLNIFDNNILYDYFYSDKKIYIPWKISYVFEWELFNKFCEIVFGFLEYMLPNYKDVNIYKFIGRNMAWKFEIICGIILSLLINNIKLEKTNYNEYFYDKIFDTILLTRSNNIDDIKLWVSKNNRTTTNMYILSDINSNEVTYEEEFKVKIIKSINEVPKDKKIIKLDINKYISCKEPNDFDINNYTIKNIVEHKKYTAIITVTQGDLEYIDEWIQYHHNIGVELICIGYNGDTENISKMPKYEYVKYFDFSTNNSEVFTEFNTKTGNYDWPALWQHSVNDIMFQYIKSFFKDYIKYVAIIDTDEFISPTEKFANITNYLDGIYDQNLSTEFIHMQFYGANDQIYYENKPVLERFVSPSNPDWPLANGLSFGYKKSIINLSHLNIDDLIIEGFHVNSHSDQNNNLPFNKIVLKHYFTKSLEEWIMKLNPQYDKNYFYRFNGKIFSTFGDHFNWYSNSKVSTEAIKAIPKLLKKYNINYDPGVEENDKKFRNLYNNINNKMGNN